MRKRKIKRSSPRKRSLYFILWEEDIENPHITQQNLINLEEYVGKGKVAYEMISFDGEYSHTEWLVSVNDEKKFIRVLNAIITFRGDVLVDQPLKFIVNGKEIYNPTWDDVEQFIETAREARKNPFLREIELRKRSTNKIHGFLQDSGTGEIGLMDNRNNKFVIHFKSTKDAERKGWDVLDRMDLETSEMVTTKEFRGRFPEFNPKGNPQGSIGILVYEIDPSFWNVEELIKDLHKAGVEFKVEYYGKFRTDLLPKTKEDYSKIHYMHYKSGKNYKLSSKHKRNPDFIILFRDLIQDDPDYLINIDYRERPISEIVREFGYEPVENMDYEYSDYKAYLNLKLREIV